MRRPGRITMIALAAVIAASCGGASSTSPIGESSPAPADGGTTAASPPDAAPAGGNPGGIVLAEIADASYTSGTAHLEVTGQRTLSTDAALVGGVSMTTEGTTLLMYAAGEGDASVLLSISNGPDTGLAMTINAANLVTGGDGSSGCGFELSRNDQSGLTGTFDCQGISTVGLDMATINVSGSFTAER